MSSDNPGTQLDWLTAGASFRPTVVHAHADTAPDRPAHVDTGTPAVAPQPPSLGVKRAHKHKDRSKKAKKSKSKSKSKSKRGKAERKTTTRPRKSKSKSKTKSKTKAKKKKRRRRLDEDSDSYDSSSSSSSSSSFSDNPYQLVTVPTTHSPMPAVVDASADPSSLSYGTVLDAPQYEGGPAMRVPVRWTLGASALPPDERRWLTSGTVTASKLELDAARAEVQIAGQLPSRSEKKRRHLQAMHGHRYFAPDAVVPSRPVNLATSQRRRDRAKQVDAARVRQKDVEAMRDRDKELQATLTAGMAAQGRVGTVVVFSGGAGAGSSGGPSSVLHTEGFSGFIPVDPVSAVFAPSLPSPTPPDTLPSRTKHLNETLRTDPTNESAWLELVSLQPPHLHDKRIAIIERALESLPVSVPLHTALLHASAQSEPRPQTDSRWKTALAASPTDTSLWLGFLWYSVSLFSSTTVSSIRHTVGMALSDLRSVSSSSSTPGMLSLLTELTSMERLSGHHERATSVWLALLEFNLDVPHAAVGKPRSTRLKFFEAYWDSGLPRLGDVPGLCGWSAWLAAKTGTGPTPAPAADSATLPPRSPPSEVDTWGVLGLLETELTAPALPPAPPSPSVAGSAAAPPAPPPSTRMVYSRVHGYRIPVPDEDDSSHLYHKILGELLEENKVSERKTAKAAAAARRSLPAMAIPPDDPLRVWVQQEDARPLSGVPVFYDHVSPCLFDVPVEWQEEMVCRALGVFGVTVHHRSSSNAVHLSTASLHADTPTGVLRPAFHPHKGTLDPFVALTSWYPPPSAFAATIDPDVLLTPSKLMFLRHLLGRLCADTPSLAGSVCLQAVRIDVEAQACCPFVGVCPPPPLADAVRSVAREVLASTQAHFSTASDPSSTPSLLPLWQAYALLESRMGNHTEAVRVLDKALALTGALPPAQTPPRFMLSAVTARLAMVGGRPDAVPNALHVLCCAAEGATGYKPWAKVLKKAVKTHSGGGSPAASVVSSTRLLKARQTYRAMWDIEASKARAAVTALTETDDRPAVSSSLFDPRACVSTTGQRLSALTGLLCCEAMFEYLANGLEPAQAVFKRGVGLFTDLADTASGGRRLCSVDMTHPHGRATDYCLYNTEVLYEWWVALLKLHSTQHSCPPRHLRTVLERAITLFPSSTLFLPLYLQSDRHTLIAIHTRTFLDSLTSASAHSSTPMHVPVSVWLALLHTELHRATARLEVMGGGGSGTGATSPHRVRRLFESALSHPRPQQCAVLWRWYLRFELACGRPLAAKKVFLRAVTACPWSKALWTDCVRRLHPYLHPTELRDLFHAMADKGVLFRGAVPV